MNDPDCYCTSLRKAVRRMGAIYDARLEPLGLTVAQFSMLRNVRRLGQPSLTELGRALELDRSTVGRNVRVLERAGLLTLTGSDDQRVAAVALTDEGAARLDRAEPLWLAAQAEIRARLPGLQGLVAELSRI